MSEQTPNHDWRPGAALAVLRQRAAMLDRIRDFFASRGVLEVETPILSRAASSEVHLHSMRVHGPGMSEAYLHTSPELAMKRLLAAGSGDIYQLCKVFRAGEQGGQHNPEFSLLEWYRTGFDMQAMMQEVGELLQSLLPASEGTAPLYLTYQEAFLRYTGLDPLQATPKQLRDTYTRLTGRETSGIGDSDWLDLILSEIVQPALPAERLVFVTGFPAAQASLARYCQGNPALACRFEVFFAGLELGNGFEELTDATEQAARIEAEQAARARAGQPCLPVDQRFLAALEAGLPACSGVAIGVDRVLMLASGEAHIARVLSFDFDRA